MKKLIIHMGAHRCGSTAVQSMLRREQAQLRENGIKVLLRADMVAGGLDLRRLHKYHSVNPIWQSKLKRAVLAVDETNAHTLLASEENLMGTMPAVRSKGFYPHFRRLVSGLARLSSMVDGKAIIAPRLVIRRQDRYLESVYAFRISRGLNQDFDSFIRNVTKAPVSWLKLAQSLAKLPASVQPKIALLEAWPKPTAGDQALAFLIGENDLNLQTKRLTGNTRHSETALRLMLALNKAKIEWQSADWKQDVFDLVDIYQDEPEADLIFALKDRIPKRHYARFSQLYSPQAKLFFDDEQRQAFLDGVTESNAELMAMDMVVSEPETWNG
ncbi:MAG: hypothetical protein JJ850_00315 [Kordiimonadaceae bacterium]|nr:hypothetical protein [Kordiimonadaceae bacterium]MBO6567758.1 hypothetical protein [Kordiimonadaceae bacterium]MBO6963027.1 hypothetical protein [Kordiimonadaceae bacterium]